MNIAGILLAAGNSTRFGRDKLVEPLGDCGMAVQSAKNILPHVELLTVVIAANNTLLQKQLQALPLTIVPCRSSHHGMAASLVCGIQYTENCDGWLVALADMPFIQQGVYEKIISAANHGHDIVAPRFKNQRGHPVFISNKFQAELLQLHGDSGARNLLQAHEREIYLIDVMDHGVLQDVDYPDDLISL